MRRIQSCMFWESCACAGSAPSKPVSRSAAGTIVRLVNVLGMGFLFILIN
jgi:hypothetical protein